MIVGNDLGRDYIFLLYGNSVEVGTLLILDLPLRLELKSVIDELLPDIEALLEGKKVSLSVKQVASIETLLNNFKEKAASPQLKKAIKKVRPIQAEQPKQ